MTLEFPPIYILDFKLSLYELHQLEREIKSNVYDIREAKVVIGNVHRKQRAKLELLQRNLHTEDLSENPIISDQDEEKVVRRPPKRKRPEKDSQDNEVINLEGSSTESEPDGHTLVLPSREKSFSTTATDSQGQRRSVSPAPDLASSMTSIGSAKSEREDTIKVLNIDWYKDSKEAGALLPMKKYLVYKGRKTTGPKEVPPAHKPMKLKAKDVLTRAQEDTPSQSTQPKHGGRHGTNTAFGQSHSQPKTRPALLTETTSEHDNPSRLPPIPEYLHTRYSCQRPTPLFSPNQDFINLLKKIRQARILISDEVSARAYSTVIASLAAYPYTLTSYQEVYSLPGCGEKIANLYQEWKETGHMGELDEIEADPMLQSSQIFFDIYDVGAKTAREFYHKGWRDLDDVVTHWNELERQQQIGVKFYDEFLEGIPRPEVEKIASTIFEHAKKIREGFQMVIVGGYRRGKATAGDLDVVLSHLDESATQDFIGKIIWELEETGYLTHSLKTSTANSKRNQQPVSWKGNSSGSGFDTLDSVLCVWQDIEWPGMEQDLERDPNAKNPNVHRRVDIIISPWKTAGCAIVGWSGGTTFERDLRWYCKYELGLKFDSSGVRSRSDGKWINVEGDEKDLFAKEKKVFESLKLDWREPEVRNTG